MSTVRVVMNLAGVRAVRNSPEMQEILLGYAERAADTAAYMTGEEFEADVRPGKARAHARASTGSDAAVRANWQTNALVKGLG